MLALEVLPEKECDETLMQKHKNHPTGKLYRRKAFVEREIAATKPFQTQQKFLFFHKHKSCQDTSQFCVQMIEYLWQFHVGCSENHY